MSTNRFFLVNAATYESIRANLDAMWGHPSNGTQTCMPPASEAVKNAQGIIVCPVLRETCDWPEVAAVLSQLLSANIITEVDESAYLSALPNSPEEP
jgi:hypothetical protein